MNCECPRCGYDDAYFDYYSGYYNCPQCDYVWGKGYGNCLNFIGVKMKKLH